MNIEANRELTDHTGVPSAGAARSNTMKAIVQDRYGSSAALQLRDIAIPAVEDHGVRVRVHASSVNPYDWHYMTGLPLAARLVGRSMGLGFRGPLKAVRGWDVAGTVDAVGKDVTRLHPGDEVYGWCDGAFAEYVSADEDNFVTRPSGMSFEQAAAVPMAALTALQGVRDQGRVEPGQKVLINGASGGVGTFAVQIAKWYGAEVTGVCSTRNVDMVRSIGADHVIDYTRDDFADDPRRFDLFLDSAVSRSLSDCRRALTPDGTYVALGDSGGRWVGGLGRVVQTRVQTPFVRQKLRYLASKPNRGDLELLKGLIEAGEITPVIEKTFPLRAAPEALAYIGGRHARAKVVITV
jgi:NADPH:quinone reductase-like Zn-dependent oxidoreductase